MLTRWLALALVAACWRVAAACSCSLQHPQQYYCNSDFVIVGRVQKLFRGKDTFNNAYKVKIRNVFKSTAKATVALKSGRIFTPVEESMCGITLKPRETYVIAGNIMHLEAHINLCNFVSRWRDVTRRQRKGFRMLYKQGCTCKIVQDSLDTADERTTFVLTMSLQISEVHETRRRTKSPNTCVTNYDRCYERHGICLHDRERRCRWTRSPQLTRCLQMTHQHNSTMT